MKRSRIANRVFNTPLLVSGRKLNQIAPILAQELLSSVAVVSLAAGDDYELGPQPPECCAGRLGFSGEYPVGSATTDQILPRTQNGVGLISVEGTLVNKGAWIGMDSGETSYQGLLAQIERARKDDSINGVVFEIDSFGGEVDGCADCGSAISDLSREKPTIAICTDHAYSAAYWLASQAGSIIIPESGGVGSIGVVSIHVDYSQFLANEGMNVTVLRSGDHKADGNPYEALPESVRDKWLKEFDQIRNQFSQAVSNGRGSRLDATAALSTEAECFMGKLAVEVGLADAVARPSEAYKAFVAQF